MKSDNTSHNDDFLHALHDDIPQNFEDDLYQRLQMLEDDDSDSTDSTDTPSRAWWTVAVACLMAVLLGGLLLMSSQSSPQTLSTPNLPLDHVNNQRISADNAALLRPFDTLIQNPASAISLSPDGSQLAVMTHDAVYLHDAHDLHADPRRLDMAYPLRDVHFLADGRLIARQNDGDDNSQVISLDTQTGTLTPLIQLPPGNVDFSELIVTDTGTQAVFAGCNQENGMLSSINGRMLCRAGNYTLTGFDLTTGDTLFSKDITEETVADIALAGNDDWLIYFPTLKDGARAHNLQSGDDIVLPLPENGLRSQHDKGNIYQVFVSEDGDQIGFSGLSQRRDVRVWSFEVLLNQALSGDDTPPAHQMIFSKYPSGDIVFHPVTEDMLMAGYDLQVISEDTDDLFAERVKLDIPIDTPQQAIFDASGERLYLLTWMGLLQTVNWPTQQPVDTLTDYIGADYAISSVSSADGQRTIVFEQGELSSMVPKLYDITGEQMTEHFLQSAPDAYHPAVTAAISPDGRFAAVLEVRDILFDTKPTLVLHDLQTGDVRDIQQLPSMPLLSRVQMAFDSENNLRILAYPGQIWHYTLEMLLDESDLPERPTRLVYLDERADWQYLMYGTVEAGVTSGFSINQDYLVAYSCMDRANAICTENVLFVWNIHNQRVADYGISENRNLARINLPDTDLRPHTYDTPTISADGNLIAIERCLEEVMVEQYFGETYYCTQSELLVWQMDAVQDGNMEPADRIALNTTHSNLAFSPQADDSGNWLLAVGGFSRNATDPAASEASTSLYQVTADATISHIQTIDSEIRPTFRGDGNVLYLRNLDTHSYRAWGVPGLTGQ